MRSWQVPAPPALPGHGVLPELIDTPTGERRRVEATDGVVSMYVCGITPYDATHLGHAATYLAYDLLGRVARDAGATVHYVQNVTDVDDPLLERATATGVDWRDLAEQQIDLFRGDMEALRILPPDHYVGVVESVTQIADAVARLRDAGLGYEVPVGDGAAASDAVDLYFDIAAAERSTSWRLGQESGLTRDEMAPLFAERGGDPDRAGKRDPLDPLLWRAERVGEPAWDSPVGRGRPGWHIECSVIGMQHLHAPIGVNGGGHDLLFPHHEFSAAHATALTGERWARVRTHAGLLSLGGTKMSKSLGNLEFVSRLVAAGVDPRAIRLALLSAHYRAHTDWTDARLADAEARLASWAEWSRYAGSARYSTSKSEARRSSAALRLSKGSSRSERIETSAQETAVLAALRTALADDLDAPAALAVVDAEVAANRPPSRTTLDAIDALLGVRL
ncbi:MAG: cysteine--1-D-myo-inosityl 2-amino-2-deoxy-alpha-D-glucopyranoside ligase [Cryobacterium sp.]|nr:cysteine--1-D-myo-inosityl 2-amino-2-deoxy-alpha-D-glucopyranoside ligase [Cryobacterium sp.]